MDGTAPSTTTEPAVFRNARRFMGTSLPRGARSGYTCVLRGVKRASTTASLRRMRDQRRFAGVRRRRNGVISQISVARGVRVVEEALMPNRVRVNLANPAELLELPGIGLEQVRAILEFRAEHGPIQDAGQLAKILRAWPVAEAIWERVAFDPAEGTAPEAPGA